MWIKLIHAKRARMLPNADELKPTRIIYPKLHKKPTMETQTTSREKSAYLDNVNVLKKKKNEPTGQVVEEKTTLQNGARWKKKKVAEEEEEGRRPSW